MEKCFYYILHWVFEEDGKARLMTKDKLSQEVKQMKIVDHSTKKLTAIPHKDTRSPHKTLGSKLRGNREARGEGGEIIRLRDKANNLAAGLQSSSLSREATKLFHQEIYEQGMRYSLAVTNIGHKE